MTQIGATATRSIANRASDIVPSTEVGHAGRQGPIAALHTTIRPSRHEEENDENS
jgi:hypothetical protein